MLATLYEIKTRLGEIAEQNPSLEASLSLLVAKINRAEEEWRNMVDVAFIAVERASELKEQLREKRRSDKTTD